MTLNVSVLLVHDCSDCDVSMTVVIVAVSCQRKVRAQKQLLIHKPPNVLTLQMKRYVSGAAGYKLSRHLNFPLQLDLRPFVTELNDSSLVIYKLYAVLVHYGMTTTSGHYYCFVLAPSGRWYKMNDATVCCFCSCSYSTSMMVIVC